MADSGGSDGPSGDAGGSPDPGQPRVVLSLPESLRHELKDPLGPVYTDASELLGEAGTPLIAVGDIVTYHLLMDHSRPAIALVDGKTKREAVEADVREAIDTGAFDHHVTVCNPAATLTADLLAELRAALDRATAGEGQSTVIEVVDGEEDLAALPALAVAPDGAGIVYGQPDEGMVLATVDDEARGSVWDLMARMDGDIERARELLGG
ncbi:MAG: GTP-dependent dephospho-CoA kinase family protein [Haloglomus sp.]